MLQGKKILITGGAGFIGSNLCHKFVEQNNEVVCLDNFLTGRRENIKDLINKNNFKLLEGDIRDIDTCKKSVKNVDVVFHQAALGSVPRSINDPITTNAINVSGFLNMLKASDEEGVSRFVYAASSSTYGDSESLPKIEEKIGNPLSPYAVTKLVNELYANVFSNLYSIETIGLRYFNVFGQKQDPEGAYAAAIPRFVKAFIDYQSPIIHGDGEQSHDFTYIDNVLQANELAATTENQAAVNQVYNVAFGENTTLNELVPLLRELLAKFDAKISEVKIEYGEDRVGDIKHSLASIAKASSLLEYRPEYSLQKGLSEAIEWYWNDLK